MNRQEKIWLAGFVAWEILWCFIAGKLAENPWVFWQPVRFLARMFVSIPAITLGAIFFTRTFNHFTATEFFPKEWKSEIATALIIGTLIYCAVWASQFS